MLTQFFEHIRSKNLIQNGDHILLGVSGGIDSMTLLHLLNRCRDDLKFTITAIQVDHHLRENSSEDKMIVKEYCEKNDIQFYSINLDPHLRSKSRSVEEWGRMERYDHFKKLSVEIDADLIMTAHHGDDQVETILMHLSEGTGLDGLKGIRERSGNIVRPLLIFSRKEIEEYALKHQIQFVEDPSNTDTHHPRNFLRYEVIPKLRESYPHLHSSFLSTSRHIHEVNEALDHSFSKWVDHYVSMEKDRTIVNLELLENEPNAYKLYLVKYLIGKNISMRKHQWENLKYLINEGNTGMILVIEDQEILKDRSTIIIKEKCNKAQNTYKVQEEQLIMDKDFTFEQKYISDHLLNDRSENETIDGDSLPNDLTLRPWNKGDQFRPLGMKGMKSVSDYLTDIKMDRFTKRDQYVLADGKEVFWLCGQRISDKVKVTPETTRFLELSFRWNVG